MADLGAASGTGISMEQLGQYQNLLFLKCIIVAGAQVSHLQLHEVLLHCAPTFLVLLDLPDQEFPVTVHSRTGIQGFWIQKPWEVKGTDWLIPTGDHSLPLGETTLGKSEQLYPGWTWTAGMAGSE